MITSRGFAQEDPVDVAPPSDHEWREKRAAGLLAASNAIRCGWENDLPQVLDMLGLREQIRRHA